MNVRFEDQIYSKEDIRVTKKRVKKIAADLCYPDIVFKKIDEAKSNIEIDNIMASARRGKYDKYREKNCEICTERRKRW